MYYTYILLCADDSYYVGSTRNLEKRLVSHNNGKGADFTSRRKPCSLIWYRSFTSKTESLKKEFEIKKFSRIKKENLIFKIGSVWEHYKGGKYIILDVMDELIIYAALRVWKDYLNRRHIAGEQCQVWVRYKNHWIDRINKKTLRFNLNLAE